ncbi:hypothetical protein D3C71_1793750 [compost metagenome]
MGTWLYENKTTGARIESNDFMFLIDTLVINKDYNIKDDHLIALLQTGVLITKLKNSDGAIHNVEIKRID